MRLPIGFGLLLVVVAALVWPTPGVVLAHETREVGPYRMEVGWAFEPPYVGETNAVELRISERDGGRGVDGAQRGLQAEVLYGSGRRQLELVPLRGTPGAYRAELIPTRPGQYRLRLNGQVGSTTVDETFESGPRSFDDVVAPTALQFPDSVPAGAGLNQALAGALTPAWVALGLAAVSLALGGGALAVALRGRRR